jgi:BASS family bile acid:Na+ symporter
VTLPIVLDLSLDFFLGAGQYVPPPHRKVIEVGAIILMPVALGMLVRARAQDFAIRAEKPIKLFSVLVLAVLIAIAIYMERAVLLPSLVAVGGACLAFNLLSMFSGYLAPLALRLPRSQAVAIAMEIGIHNAALAIYIALNVLKNPAVAVVPGIYSLVMYVTATLFVLLLLPRQRATSSV